MNPRLLQFLALLLTLTAGTVSAGEPFFQSCDPALDTPPFKRLHEFYSAHPKEPLPDSCFRLNSREFLVTVTATGRVGQGLYYFNADTGNYTFPDGAYRANIGVKREFEGPRKKRFVILETSNLHGGNWDTGYELLFLKPRGEGYSFQIQKLLFVAQDPEDGMCGSRITEGTASEVESLRVEREGTTATSLVFVISSQACPNGEKRNYERRFVWSMGAFREAP